MISLKNKKLFTESLNLLKRNILYFLLLDASLIVSLYSINYLMSSYIFDFRNMLAVIQQNNMLVFVLLPLIVLYLLILLLVYSVFKYFTLEIIAEKESENKFRNILRLYSLNTKIFGLFFIVFAMINIIFFNIRDEYMLYFAIVALFPFILLLTLFIDILHGNFILHDNNKLRFKLVFENKRFLAFKIFLYLTLIALYSLYNYLGINGSILLIPYTITSIIYTYLMIRFEGILSVLVFK
ncbi:hypothetical protein HYU06_04050 [Candidatus Woesearchaeota archaeon]|nr:hypothetical protein [Candidatus Woesearchaeota archaeon]